MALQTEIFFSNLGVVRRFHKLAGIVSVEIKWMLRYSKIKGNEEADALARSALSQLPQAHITPEVITNSYRRQLMNQRHQELLDSWWIKTCPMRYQELGIKMRCRKPP